MNGTTTSTPAPLGIEHGLERECRGEPVRATVGEGRAVFLSFIASRELRYPREAVGGRILDFGARSIGLSRDAEVEWVSASGKATLHSYTVYHRAYGDDFTVPYNVAWVELEEGPRLVSTVVPRTADAPLVTLRIGMPLVAVFDAAGRLVFHPDPK